jgi:hypothetical protein
LLAKRNFASRLAMDQNSAFKFEAHIVPVKERTRRGACEVAPAKAHVISSDIQARRAFRPPTRSHVPPQPSAHARARQLSGSLTCASAQPEFGLKTRLKRVPGARFLRQRERRHEPQRHA